jgi:hypothetical protein
MRKETCRRLDALSGSGEFKNLYALVHLLLGCLVPVDLALQAALLLVHSPAILPKKSSPVFELVDVRGVDAVENVRLGLRASGRYPSAVR